MLVKHVVKIRGPMLMLLLLLKNIGVFPLIVESTFDTAWIPKRQTPRAFPFLYNNHQIYIEEEIQRFD